MVNKALILYNTNKFNDSIRIYNHFLKLYGDSKYSDSIRIQIKEIQKEIDYIDFQALESVKDSKLKVVIAKYEEYLKLHPFGRYKKDAQNLIIDLIDNYYRDFSISLSELKKYNKWWMYVQQCEYFEKELTSLLSSQNILTRLKNRILKELEDDKQFAILKNRIGEQSNYDQRKTACLLFITQYPYTKYKADINEEIAKIDNRLAEDKDWAELLSYLKKSSIQIEKKIDRLEQYLTNHSSETYATQAKHALRELKELQEWDYIKAFTNNVNNSIQSRINKLKFYLSNNSKENSYFKVAQKLLDNLQNQRKAKLVFERKNKEKLEWGQQLKYINDGKIALSVKLKKLTSFISKKPKHSMIDDAIIYLNKLKNLLYFENLTKSKFNSNSKLNEFYKYNNDGTIIDLKTGLMWCLFDTSAEHNRCLHFNDIDYYIKNLNYGGYTDWRLPSVNELKTIYFTKSTFPAAKSENWYWSSSRVYTEAGTKNRFYYRKSKYEAYSDVVMSDTGRMGKIESGKGCGGVRAVRWSH